LALVSRVKTTWDLNADAATVAEAVDAICARAQAVDGTAQARQGPLFLQKLFPDGFALAELYALKTEILTATEGQSPLREFLLLALVGAARDATRSKVDGVYVAPETRKASALPPATAFRKRIAMMLGDLSITRGVGSTCDARVCEGDARALDMLKPDRVSLVFTSPPYLNNFDYAEMTRLELYLLGMASSWHEITAKVRSKLLVSSTTQITRAQGSGIQPDPRMPGHVQERIAALADQLRSRRRVKAGRKDYDITIVAYFNGMRDALSEMLRVLRPGARAILTVGDSGLYGVHVPTDEILRDIALGLGFSHGNIKVLRQRGYRWVLPRRETLPLRESHITLWK